VDGGALDRGVLDTCGTEKIASTDLEWGSPMCICAGIEHQAPIPHAACWDKAQELNRDCSLQHLQSYVCTHGIADSICHILTVVCLPRLEFCDKETQQKWFRRHFELAASFKLPMFLHMRAAAPDFIAILKEHRSGCTHVMPSTFAGLPFKAVLLCVTLCEWHLCSYVDCQIWTTYKELLVLYRADLKEDTYTCNVDD